VTYRQSVKKRLPANISGFILDIATCGSAKNPSNRDRRKDLVLFVREKDAERDITLQQGLSLPEYVQASQEGGEIRERKG